MLEMLINKVVFDFNGSLSNVQLHNTANIRSSRAVSITNDTCMLNGLCQTNNTELAIRLLSKAYMMDRSPSKILFFGFSKKRVYRLSFIKSVKTHYELIPFAWPDLPGVKLKTMIMSIFNSIFDIYNQSNRNEK